MRLRLLFVVLAFVIGLGGWVDSADRERIDNRTDRRDATLSTERELINTIPFVLVENEIEQGRAVFEGKGNCTVCHTIGGEDEKKNRWPDLADIGGRAGQRAKQSGVEGPYAGTLYLIRSIVHPGEDVVEGYNPAPESWLPSGLTNDEIRSVVVFLQSLGGIPAPTEVSLPLDWLAAKRQEYQRELKLYSFGDADKGRQLFHDAKGKAGCVKCHQIDGVGKDTCPDLTAVNRIYRPSHLLESIIDSSAVIVRGYRQTIILDAEGRVLTGLPVKEDEQTITVVVDQKGQTEVIQKDDIEEEHLSKVSIMPGDFGKHLSAGQVINVVAYLIEHDSGPSPELAGADKGEPSPTVESPMVTAPLLDVFDSPNEGQRRYRTAMERGDPVIGARIYAHYCVMCHGHKGDGTGFNAVNLTTKPANHTDNRRMSKTEDLLLHGVVSRGGMKTGRSFLMPP